MKSSFRAGAGVLVAVLAIAVSIGALPRSLVGTAEAAAADGTVKLVIDYNDGSQRVFPALPWQDGMTVLAALEAAKANPHGIAFRYTGKNETAFLTQIDDLKNEGGGKDKKNWLYRVNDKLADKSLGVYTLQAGDVVVWKFDVYTGK